MVKVEEKMNESNEKEKNKENTYDAENTYKANNANKAQREGNAEENINNNGNSEKNKNLHGSENDNVKMEFEKEPQTLEEKEINELRKKLDAQRVTIDENEDRIKRLMAEFENFKKRSNKERESLYSSVMGDVITSLLPAIDNLEKAAEAETKDEQYKNGVKMCLDQIHDVLKSNGVTVIETIGKKFDPSLHEAVSLVTDPNLGEKVIKQEYRKGYMIGDRVLRHSLVVVAN